MVPKFNEQHKLALLTDLYQLTMAYGYWKSGIYNRQAIFHLYYRKAPFNGQYVLSAGLESVIAYLKGIRFELDDILYLGSLKQNGKTLFDEAFLNYLQRWEFACDVDAIPEGNIVFPNQPLIRVKGPIIQAQIIESALLNLVNYPTLIATKAARVTQAAKENDILEFGLRRAQGIDGAMTASRSAYLGGCAATSNVLAGKRYGIPVRGTHAHSWIMAFDNEIEAFSNYAEAMPYNCIFLVDTYDSIEGVKNAIKVGLQLREKGHQLIGIRLDSGDQVELSKTARKLLDEAGLTDTKIIGGNDLDEYKLAEMKSAGAVIDIWGIGTKLVTAYDQPALGGVYKLAAIQDETGEWQYRMKHSENPAKSSYPGQLQTIRYYDEQNRPIADYTYDELDTLSPTSLPENAAQSKVLLTPVFRKGILQKDNPLLFDEKGKYHDLGKIRHVAIDQWKQFTKINNYPNTIAEHIIKLREDLRKQKRNKSNSTSSNSL